MLLVDVHAHLDTTFYGTEVDVVINRALKNNVKAIIANGVDRKTNREVLELSKKYGLVKAALGIYPPDALGIETNAETNWDLDDELVFIEKNIKKIIAVGEVGLDYKNGKDKEKQINLFKKLIEIAKKNNKPLIVHSRRAEKDVIDVLEGYNYGKIIMHCFNGNHKLVQRVRDNRWFFSIPTNVVRSEHMQKIVKETPLSQLLTETDSPFLSPYRDKRNEPSFVVESVKKMAEIKELEAEETANNIWMNYERLFK
ncbi:TatD family hydrolase [Candidatus Woesearchaeota archaeon]|nr:TatD family hydrolase [Candidatus Woesearchaeota archaeon]